MKNIIKILAVFTLIATLLLTACSGNIKSKMVGSWSFEEDGEPQYTLYSDGTCKIAYQYGTGTWAIVNNNQLKLTNYYGESNIAEIESVSKSEMVLSIDGDSITLYKVSD